MKSTKLFLTAATLVGGTPTQALVQAEEIGAESDRKMGAAQLITGAELASFVGLGLLVFVGSTRVTASNLNTLAATLPAIV